MSVTGKKGIGIPIILLHDAEGAIVTVELKVYFIISLMRIFINNKILYTYFKGWNTI